MFALFSFLEMNPLFTLTHENYMQEVLENENPLVVLYSPSPNGPAIFSEENKKILGYTLDAFKRSARHFSGRIRFAYFDLQTCLEPDWSGQDVVNHMQIEHTLPGYPVVVLYQKGKAHSLQEKELTRLETGIPFPKAKSPYVKGLDFLVTQDLIKETYPPYILNADGRIVPASSEETMYISQ